jgi:hypothetical protein
MVWFSQSAFDQFIANIQRKRNVYQAVAVDVTNFAATYAVFCAAKTMCRMLDRFPTRDLSMDSLSSTLHRHPIAPDSKQLCL